MSTTFDTAFEHTVGIEGGYSNDPNDAGGETMYGITIVVARAYGYQGAMIDLPLETAKDIYKRQYWNINSLDAVAKISEQLAIEIFDSGVNIGTVLPIQWLQQGLNALNRNNTLFSDLSVDRLVGPSTLKALALLDKTDLDVLLKIVNIYQGYHYLSVCLKNPTQEKYVRGWLKRVSFEKIV